MTEEYGDIPDAFFLPKERLVNPDEIVLENVKLFHMENMTPNHLWLSCSTEDGKLYHLNIHAKGNKLNYYWSEEQ